MIKSIITLLLLSSMFLACTPENRDKYTPPEQVRQKITNEAARVIEHKPNKNVDILFIIDPSSSMASIIKEVHDNIDRFAEKFIDDKSSNVKFRIGVTTAWDSAHFAKVKLQNENTQIFRQHFWPNLDFKLVQGALRSVIVDGQERTDLPPFITHDMTDDLDKMYDTIRESLKVNAEIYRYELYPNRDDKVRNVHQLTRHTSEPEFQDLNDREFVTYFVDKNKNDVQDSDEKDKILFGPSPENEEFFSVIQSMLTEEKIKENQGFPSRDANQLAVFIITDAEDDVHNRHGISPDKIYSDLVKFMGNDKSKVVVFGALYESTREDCEVRSLDQAGNFKLEPKYINGHVGVDGDLNPNYKEGKDTFIYKNKDRDPGLTNDAGISLRNKPSKIERLIRLSGGTINSICSKNFGADLATVGLNIKNRTLEQKDVFIDTKTAFDKSRENIKVFYGEDKIDNFKLSFEHDSVIIVPSDSYTFVEGRTFRVEISELTSANKSKK